MDALTDSINSFDINMARLAESQKELEKVVTDLILERDQLRREKQSLQQENQRMLMRLAIRRTVMQAVYDDLIDRYDGAPDSGCQWMAGHIRDLKECLGL